jgi:hypothetical protein
MTNSKLDKSFNKTMSDTVSAFSMLSHCSNQKCKQYQKREKDINKKYSALRQKIAFKDLKQWSKDNENLNMQQDKELHDLHKCIISECNHALINVVRNRMNVDKVQLQQTQDVLKNKSDNATKKMLMNDIKRMQERMTRDKQILEDATKGTLSPSQYREALLGKR